MKLIYLKSHYCHRAAADPPADRLVIKGSDTLGAKLVPQLAEQFKAQHPGTTFDIAAEGSTTGIAAIIDGTAQIGMSSRRAKPSEVGAASAKGVNMKPTIVAYDGIAVIVNLSQSDQKPDQETGRTNLHRRSHRLERGRRIGRQDFDLHPQHFVRHLFRLQGAGDEETRLRGRLAEDGRQRTDRRRSRKESNGVGYVGLAYTKAGGVKVVPIDGALLRSKASRTRPIPTGVRPSTTRTANRAVWPKFLDFTNQRRRPEDRRPGRLCSDQVG